MVELRITDRLTELLIEGLASLSVELSRRESRAEDFELIEWFAEYLQEKLEDGKKDV